VASVLALVAAGMMGIVSLHPLAARGMGIPGGVAFNTMGDRNAGIHGMDADGRSPTRLTNDALNQMAAWDPTDRSWCS